MFVNFLEQMERSISVSFKIRTHFKMKYLSVPTNFVVLIPSFVRRYADTAPQ